MRLYHRDTEYFYISFSYDPALVAEVKKFPDAGFNPENKEWYIPVSIATLSSIKMWLADRGFEEGMVYFPSKRVLEYEPPEEILTAADVQEGCAELGLTRTPRHYQAEGIAYMINHGNCINGDGCGLGKTGQSICVAELLDCFPLLVISPASVKYNWKKEWAQWNPSRTVGVVDTHKKKTLEGVWDNDVVVINYDILGERCEDKPKAKFRELVRKHWKGCIIDEIHFLKSDKALRTRMARKITSKIENVWGLTGTLTQNKPIDLVEPYRILRRFDEVFGSGKEFKFRYCNAKFTKYGFDYSGFSNLEELHEMLTMSGYIRRNKRDVLDELPPLIEERIDVPISNTREYQKAEDDLLDYLAKIDINKASNAANAPHLVMIQTLKALSVQGKLKFIQQYIQDWLDSNEEKALVVFGVHREPLQTLAEHFKAPVLQGGISPSKKQQIVDEFSQGRHRVLFANIQTAGTGTDGLQKASSDLIYIELPDRFTDIEQTNSRLERMGQENSITVTYLLSNETIDVEMWDMVQEKGLITGVVNRGASENTLLAKKFLLSRAF